MSPPHLRFRCFLTAITLRRKIPLQNKNAREQADLETCLAMLEKMANGGRVAVILLVMAFVKDKGGQLT